MIFGPPVVRAFPVILPALSDELLSSWLRRHAAFYGVGERRILRYCLVDVPSFRHLDLRLAVRDQNRLGDVLRCGALAVRRMTQSRNGKFPMGPVATVRPMQVCKQCIGRHGATAVTRGARLRSWMEGWRISCPVCGARLDDARPTDLATSVDATEPLLIRTEAHARNGELLIDKGVRHTGQVGTPVIELMRVLLLPRTIYSEHRSSRTTLPRLLDVVVSGFDQHLREHHPHFRPQGTLLLPISIRIPVLAGVSMVATRPDYWAERLVGSAGVDIRDRLVSCLRSLCAAKRPAHLRQLHGFDRKKTGVRTSVRAIFS
jgi:hypothetical protein